MSATGVLEFLGFPGSVWIHWAASDAWSSMALDGEMERLRRESQQLRKTVGHLELQVEELGVECDDLRQICAAKNVSIGDALAARRHHRMFAKARADHPLGSMQTSSEVLSAFEISHSDSRRHTEYRGIALRGKAGGRTRTSCRRTRICILVGP